MFIDNSWLTNKPFVEVERCLRPRPETRTRQCSWCVGNVLPGVVCARRPLSESSRVHATAVCTNFETNNRAPCWNTRRVGFMDRAATCNSRFDVTLVFYLHCVFWVAGHKHHEAGSAFVQLFPRRGVAAPRGWTMPRSERHELAPVRLVYFGSRRCLPVCACLVSG